MSISLQAIPNAFHLPRPNWDAIRAWVEKNIPEPDRRSAWSDIAEQWLDRLNEALGGAYQPESSADLILFAPSSFPHTKSILRFADRSLVEICDLLGDVAGESWLGPLVILLFEDGESYYTYINQFFPEGEFGGTGGMCLKEGYVHVALHPNVIDNLQLCVVHEITHACLAQLNLPLWLEEGVTQFAEQSLHSLAQANLDRQEIAEMRAHWRQHGLAKFWWGDGFFSPDEEQQHSYRLAAILFRLLVTDHRRSLPLLIRHANAADAGDSALRESCGKTAAELMSQVLGSGEWTPEPPDSHAYCRRGAFYLEQKIISIAMTDLNRAIQLDPRVAEFYFYRGECFRNQHQFEAAIEDFHTAVQLDAKNFYAHNNLAWLFATCPDDRIRDADQAIEHANRACELSHFGPWFCLGTLAAAHAEAGDFDEARRWAKESLRFAPAAELPGCQERLKLYQAKQPWRDKPLRAL